MPFDVINEVLPDSVMSILNSALSPLFPMAISSGPKDLMIPF